MELCRLGWVFDMYARDDLLAELLTQAIASTKVGVLVKHVIDIDPATIAKQVAESIDEQLRTAIIGYEAQPITNEQLVITTGIEEAVEWRSHPEYGGKILVFVKAESERMHSLQEFDLITTRSLANYLIDKMVAESPNEPTRAFWAYLKDTVDQIQYSNLEDFVQAIDCAGAGGPTSAIPANMWRLNLIRDDKILGSKTDCAARITRNREMIIQIGQLSETSRKNMGKSLARADEEDKAMLNAAYRHLQEYFKLGRPSDLKELDYEHVDMLLRATKKQKPKPKPKPDDRDEPSDEPQEPSPKGDVKTKKELDSLINDTMLDDDPAISDQLRDFCDELKKHYDPENDEIDGHIPGHEGVFGGRAVNIPKENSNLRKIVGRFCTEDVWGGIIESPETELRDAISTDNYEVSLEFRPNDDECKEFGYHDRSFSGLLKYFDELITATGAKDYSPFAPTLEKLNSARGTLVANLDLIMHYPQLVFFSDPITKRALYDYIESWNDLLNAYIENRHLVQDQSENGSEYISHCLLCFDAVYIKAGESWKGILLPLHPMFLWRYYEVFKSLDDNQGSLSASDKEKLSKTLSSLPQVLDFLIVDRFITNDRFQQTLPLPCSGELEMLPTYQNKTNRYLGFDGLECIGDTLARWIAYAPYTKDEIRMCVIDTPDLATVLDSISDILDKGVCKRVVCTAFYTRGQNGNAEFGKIFDDSDDSNFNIAKYIRREQLDIKICSLNSSDAVAKYLRDKPVHLSFFFDQSMYSIEYGTRKTSLYINPLVVTYQYEFYETEQKGDIFPSSDTESGFVGNYYKVIQSTGASLPDRSPRRMFSTQSDTGPVVKILEDGSTQWLIVADRSTNEYNPQHALPIGEKVCGSRMVSSWASTDSRIVKQYLDLLTKYNLYPRAESLVGLLKEFGHISSTGLIGIPKSGTSASNESIKKGLLGTLFACEWYRKQHPNALIASLDTANAKLWLQNSDYGRDRADLIAVDYDEDEDLLTFEIMEVKTRDESCDAIVGEYIRESRKHLITGHAADQVAEVVEMVQEIFGLRTPDSPNMFVAARKEVLKYQIVSECFRSLHNPTWQKKWSDIFKIAFGDYSKSTLRVNVGGKIVHIRLSEATGGNVQDCIHPEYDDCPIELVTLSAQEIQEQVFGEKVVHRNYAEESSDAEGEQESGYVPTSPLDSYDNDSDGGSIEQDAHDDPPGEGVRKSAAGTPLPLREESKNASDISAEIANMDVQDEDIETLVKDFRKACDNYNISLKKCDADDAVVGPSVIRVPFILSGGQSIKPLQQHLEDIGREMKRSGVLLQPKRNSNEIALDIPRRNRVFVSYSEIANNFSVPSASPEELLFPIGRTPEGNDIIKNLGDMPHLLVGGSTGSGKSVFLFCMLVSILRTHQSPDDLKLILCSSGMEDFVHFEGLPHLLNGKIISDADEAKDVITETVFTEFQRREEILRTARVANIIEYNQKHDEKLPPLVVVVDEFADLTDQLGTKKEKNEFFTPVKRIAQLGRKRGIHLVLCTQRPSADMVPGNIKAQLNGRLALRVNDAISSRMIIEEQGAQMLSKHGDLIYKNGDETQRAQGYYISTDELDRYIGEITS